MYMYIYRMIHEKMSVFQEETELVIARKKKVRMNMCLILNGYRDGAV